MIGGLITSAFLTLEVIPVLYTIWRTRQLSVARGGLRAPAIAGADAPRDAHVTKPSNGVQQPRIGGRRPGTEELDL
jgi:hypothetical protein